MKQKKSDISLLLIILVLFSASIGLLHGFKITLVSAATPQESKQLALSLQDMVDLLVPHVISDNMKKVAEGIYQFDQESQKKVMRYLLDEASMGLTDVQKIQLLAALAAQEEDIARKAELFDVLHTYFSKEPLFSVIVTDYPELIMQVEEWAKKEDKKDIFNKWKHISIIHALQLNDVPLLTALYTNGIRLTPKEASMVLDRVVTEKKDVGFVPLLVRKFGADVHYSSDGKKTILIKAVETNNPDMVRVLVDEGANPRLILNSQVGSAEQVAAERGFVEIEKILDTY